MMALCDLCVTETINKRKNFEGNNNKNKYENTRGIVKSIEREIYSQNVSYK